MGSEIAARVGIAPAAGQRRLADRDVAVAGDRRSAGEYARDQAENGIRTQRINARPLPVKENGRPQAVTTEKTAAGRVVKGLIAQRALDEVHPEHPACESPCHGVPPCLDHHGHILW